MRKTLFLPVGLIMTAMIFYSCQEDQAAAPDKHISKEVLDRIWEIGFNNENVQKVEEGYLVEGDILLTEENLQVQIDPLTLRIAEVEQYRTYNLVSPVSQTITVSMDANLNSTPGYNQALDLALARYNAAGITLLFQRVGTSGGEIHLKKQPGNYLASAGFPLNNGNPYPTIKLNSNAIGQGTGDPFIKYCATIMAHEIGHCIGMRHTDYMDRAFSCNSGGNEGAGNVGAVHIPGTPTGPEEDSWMLACIGSLEDRPFTNNDRTALSYLY